LSSILCKDGLTNILTKTLTRNVFEKLLHKLRTYDIYLPT